MVVVLDLEVRDKFKRNIFHVLIFTTRFFFFMNYFLPSKNRKTEVVFMLIIFK